MFFCYNRFEAKSPIEITAAHEEWSKFRILSIVDHGNGVLRES